MPTSREVRRWWGLRCAARLKLKSPLGPNIFLCVFASCQLTTLIQAKNSRVHPRVHQEKSSPEGNNTCWPKINHTRKYRTFHPVPINAPLPTTTQAARLRNLLSDRGVVFPKLDALHVLLPYQRNPRPSPRPGTWPRLSPRGRPSPSPPCPWPRSLFVSVLGWRAKKKKSTKENMWRGRWT